MQGSSLGERGQTLTERAEEVLRRLRAKPELYREVLRLVSEDREVGPWERRRSTRPGQEGVYYDWWERMDSVGESVGQVAPLPPGSGMVGWQWQVRGGRSGNGSGAEECMVSVDAELRRLGYVPK